MGENFESQKHLRNQHFSREPFLSAPYDVKITPPMERSRSAKYSSGRRVRGRSVVAVFDTLAGGRCEIFANIFTALTRLLPSNWMLFFIMTFEGGSCHDQKWLPHESRGGVEGDRIFFFFVPLQNRASCIWGSATTLRARYVDRLVVSTDLDYPREALHGLIRQREARVVERTGTEMTQNPSLILHSAAQVR